MTVSNAHKQWQTHTHTHSFKLAYIFTIWVPPIVHTPPNTHSSCDLSSFSGSWRQKEFFFAFNANFSNPHSPQATLNIGIFLCVILYTVLVHMSIYTVICCLLLLRAFGNSVVGRNLENLMEIVTLIADFTLLSKLSQERDRSGEATAGWCQCRKISTHVVVLTLFSSYIAVTFWTAKFLYFANLALNWQLWLVSNWWSLAYLFIVCQHSWWYFRLRKIQLADRSLREISSFRKYIWKFGFVYVSSQIVWKLLKN